MSKAINGRGARSNASGRYEADRREAYDDGWTDQDEAATPLRTTLSPEHARTIIAKNTSPDVGFDRSSTPTRAANMAGSTVLLHSHDRRRQN